MFSRHRRKVGLLFALSDILITALAFEAAYQSRVWLPFEQVFYLIVPVKALLLGFSVLAWLLIGFWLNVYGRLDSGYPARVLCTVFHVLRIRKNGSTITVPGQAPHSRTYYDPEGDAVCPSP